MMAGRVWWMSLSTASAPLRGGGVEPGVSGGAVGVGTLLGPEGSRVERVSLASFPGCFSLWGVGGVGGCGVWLLNSGREHLMSPSRFLWRGWVC
jgi:hypothetical protein